MVWCETVLWNFSLFFFVLFLIDEEKICNRWTDCLVCVDRLAHLGVQAWCLTKTNFTKTSKSLQLYLQQMCIEAEELLPGDSNAIFRPMDIDESARPLEGCVLSVRYGAVSYTHLTLPTMAVV